MTNSPVVYVRTPLGRSTAFNPASALKEPLQGLLKAVDGKAHVDNLAERFANIEDIAALLGQLKAKGLIAERGAAQPSTEAGTPSPQASDSPRNDHSLFDLMAQQAAETMATFVLTHVPAKAFTLLGQIERIHTIEELKGYLPDYETEIQTAGTAAHTHTAELKQVLEKLV